MTGIYEYSNDLYLGAWCPVYNKHIGVVSTYRQIGIRYERYVEPLCNPSSYEGATATNSQKRLKHSHLMMSWLQSPMWRSLPRSPRYMLGKLFLFSCVYRIVYVSYMPWYIYINVWYMFGIYIYICINIYIYIYMWLYI